VLLPNGPKDAKWLNDDERGVITASLASEPKHDHTTLMPMFMDPRVWLLAIPDFGIVLALYGVNLWAPTIVKGMGFTNIETGFIVAAPYLVSMIVMVLWGMSSDARGERVWHIATAATIGAIGLVGVAFFQSHLAILLSLGVAVCGTYAALAVFWTLPPSFLGGTAAAGGIALINSISNLGGFFGPTIMGWLKETTGGFSAGLLVLAAGMLTAAVLVLLVGRTLTFAGRAALMERFTRLNAS
ncbi:MAG: MFS transporter, partial [Alphaproteobacteria bacterium]|nr:MFS transporter [Alphaproteobacteria bacterium]